MSKRGVRDEVAEYAVLYGDGEAEPMESPEAANAHIKDLRARFGFGYPRLDPCDYEPMKVVQRRVITKVSRWKDWKP